MLKFENEIKLIISDFDGIFTDGSIYISEDGKTSKRLHFMDIMAVSMLLKNGYKFAIVSGENSAASEYLKKKFDLEDVFGGIRIKAPIVEQLLEKYSLKPCEVIYIGDDFNDIGAMKLVSNRVTVPNANFKVKEVENVQITSAFGGNGAFREVSDTLIHPQK